MTSLVFGGVASVLFIWAVAVGLSRVIVGVHFPGDIVAARTTRIKRGFGHRFCSGPLVTLKTYDTKILYGVQGTGQGHVSRARGLAYALRDFDVDVTWLFSGRENQSFLTWSLLVTSSTAKASQWSPKRGECDTARRPLI